MGRTTTLDLMTLVPVSAADFIAVAGDWHGNLGWALRALKIAHAAGARTVVQLGDFGYWRRDPATTKYLRRLERQLAELEMRLLWVDGNHEDHVLLRSQPLDEDGARPISEHVTHLPRGYRWTWPGPDGTPRIWLALGGAVSMDRDNRTRGRSWWPEEAITDQDIERAASGGRADVMVTHDAPHGVAVPGSHNTGWPDTAVADAQGHRRRLRAGVDVVRPHELWHGHYHVRYDGQLDLGAAADSAGTDVCHVHGLDRDDTHWARTSHLSTPLEDLRTGRTSSSFPQAEWTSPRLKRAAALACPRALLVVSPARVVWSRDGDLRTSRA